jgi:phage terminase small subunit
MDFLSENGRLVYNEIEKHCRERLKMFEVDHFEMAMLANSIDLYAQSAKYCLDNGVKFTIITEKGASYEQICPEYTVMKNEYQNIIKHSSKFGLNPGDRAKFFKGLEDKKGKKGFNLDGKMKVA